jgi:TPR repeat protein
MRAAFFLALTYENGFGVTTDLALATELYKAVAVAGITYAHNKFRDCNQTGAGILLDDKVYRQAADLGDCRFS